MNSRACVLAAVAALLLAFGNARAQTSARAETSYKLVKTIDLPGTRGGTGGMIAVDGESGTVWVAQAPSGSVVVIETRDNTVRRVIDGIDGPRGIGFSEHYAFVSDDANNAVLVVGKRSLEKATVLKPAGRQPDAVYFDSRHGTLWIAAAGGEATVFKAVGQGGFKRLAGLRLKPASAGERPGIGLYLAGKERIFQPSGDAIDVINPVNRKIEHVWKLDGAGRVTSLAYDAKTDRLVAGTAANELMILDSRAGKLAAKIPVKGAVGQVSIDPALRRAYAADQAGQVDVVDLDHNILLAVLPSEPGLHSLAADGNSHFLYVYRDRANKIDVLAPR
jgi:DNA-binding beta-propeller fold protein YncE